MVNLVPSGEMSGLGGLGEVEEEEVWRYWKWGEEKGMRLKDIVL